MVSEPQRSELATALRGWRRRGRVSQLELALSAGTTQRHVSFIESGRSVPGRGMVLRLAEALGVPLRERNALLLAAGYAPAYHETQFDDPELAPVRTALERVLEGHHPYPAGMAPRIVNLDVWAWHVIDALQRETARNPSERLEALVSELEGLVPDRPQAAAPDYLGFAVPLRLRSDDGELQLLTTLTHFGTAVDVTVAELRLEAFLPADEVTASILAERGRAMIAG